jgi:hypothetical protein
MKWGVIAGSLGEGDPSLRLKSGCAQDNDISDMISISFWRPY